MKEIIPKGHKIEIDGPEDILITPKGESFVLKNRTFDEINRKFNGCLSEIIDYLKKRGRGQIEILDIGGGIEARSIRDIVEREKDNPKVHVSSIDIAARPQQESRANQIVADMRVLPFKDNSIDLAYSYMAMRWMEGKDFSDSVKEIIRVLKPGGILITDSSNARLRILMNDYDFLLSPALTNSGDFLEKFTILIKKPVDRNLIKRIGLELLDE